MPMREVHLRRWQLGAAFAVLTIVFVVGLVLVSNASDKAQRASERAQKVSAENWVLIRRLDRSDKRQRELVLKLSQQRRVQVYELCTDVNAVKIYLRATLQQGLVESRKLAYYRQHPDELRRVERLTRERIVALKLRECPPNPGNRGGDRGP